MKAFICSLLASLMLAFGVHTASLADDGKSDDVSIDYGAQLSAEAEDALVSFQRSLDRIVAKTGAKLSNVSVDQSLSNSLARQSAGQRAPTRPDSLSPTAA
jgi:hypothetical protein